MLEPILPPDVPRPLDQELLAWAAGFFDGEGTTFARTDARRPGYFQLDVSVPQAGRDAVPEVLLKFQRAMLGMGVIRLQPDGVLHKWCSGGRLAALTTLALLWPWLGTVKREQARAAAARVEAQFASGERVQREARYAPTFIPHVVNCASPVESSLSYAWAAGFLDAEGYFGNPRRYLRKDGSAGLTVRASATQHGEPGQPAAVLLRLRDALGGRIERHGEIDDFKWVTEGLPAVTDVFGKVEPWLGLVKRTQATAALVAAEATRVRGGRERCLCGHLYDRVYVGPDGRIHRICNACDRLRDRAARAAIGGRARDVRHRPSDSTRAYNIG